MPSSEFSGAARPPSARRKRHRPPARTNRAFAWVAVGVCFAAFGGGFTWKKVELRNNEAELSAAPATTDPDTRMVALREIDEALRARHEKRTSGALAALDRARRADPSLPGLQVAFAEIAFNEREFSELRKAASAAQADASQSAAASVLLGVEKWLSRGGSDREMMSAADSASAQFSAATETDFFAPAAWYFQADVLRYAGREDEGRERALGALHRYQPWDSSEMLAAKAIFASAELGETAFGGLAFLPDSVWVKAVADAADQGGAPAPGFAAQVGMQFLLTDPFLLGKPEAPAAKAAGLPVLP